MSASRRSPWAVRPVVRLGKAGAPEDRLAREEPLEIRVAGEVLATTLRTPGHDRELAAGFLFAEGVIAGTDDLVRLTHCGRPGTERYGNAIEATPAGGARVDPDRLRGARRGTLVTSACGVCGRDSLDDAAQRARPPRVSSLPRAMLFSSVAALRELQPGFDQTGGLHAAAIWAADGRLLAHAEDIGRHNAVDKAVGTLVLSGALPRQTAGADAPALLTVTSRAGYEVVQKASAAGLCAVACVGAASALAAELAEETGLLLAGFVRGESASIYAHPERLRDEVG